jgi:hypothetical protein
LFSLNRHTVLELGIFERARPFRENFEEEKNSNLFTS